MALYATVLLNKLGDAVFSFFVAAYLYSIGIPLAGVILFFGCEFGLRGILSPLGAMAVARFGCLQALGILEFTATYRHRRTHLFMRRRRSFGYACLN